MERKKYEEYGGKIYENADSGILIPAQSLARKEALTNQTEELDVEKVEWYQNHLDKINELIDGEDPEKEAWYQAHPDKIYQLVAEYDEKHKQSVVEPEQAIVESQFKDADANNSIYNVMPDDETATSQNADFVEVDGQAYEMVSDNEIETNEEIAEIDDGEQADEVIEQLNDPATPERKKRGLLERIRHSKWFIKTVAFASAVLMLTGAGLGGLRTNNKNYAPNSAIEHVTDKATDSNIEQSSEIETGDTENAQEKEYSFENHEVGDPIYYNQEKLQEGIDKLENKEHHLWNIEAETPQESLEKLREGLYTRAEVMAGFMHGGVVGIELNSLAGEPIDFNDSEQVTQFIQDLNNNPEYRGQIYDTINQTVLSNVKSVEWYDLNEGNWSTVYHMTDKVDGLSKIAVDFDAIPTPGRGIKVTFQVGEESYAMFFREKCAQKYTERKQTTVKRKTIITTSVNIVPNEASEPEPAPQEPEVKKEVPPILTEEGERPGGGEEKKEEHHEKEHHEEHDEAKNPTVDINVNKDLPEQVEMGEQRVDDGSYRESEDVTTTSYEAPAESVTVDNDLMQQIDEMLNEQEETLNQSYDAEPTEAQQTLEENQNGQGEADKSYAEATVDAEVADTSEAASDSAESADGGEQSSGETSETNNGTVSGF